MWPHLILTQPQRCENLATELSKSILQSYFAIGRGAIALSSIVIRSHSDSNYPSPTITGSNTTSTC